jgi:hypothetical protein
MLRILRSGELILALTCFALAGAARGAPAVSGAVAAISLPAGHYSGSLTISGISPCEQYIAGINAQTHVMQTAAFLTIAPKASTLLLEYEKNNTKAADYFQTSEGTLALTPGRMVGGKRHATLYYFDMVVKRDRGVGSYVATGDWIIQDGCESQGPRYDATLKLKASPRH